MIYLAGASSLPLSSVELCNSAGTNPDGGLPFRRRAPKGLPASPGSKSRCGSRSTRRNSEEFFAPCCRGRASALSSRLRPRHRRRSARTLDEIWSMSRPTPKSHGQEKTPSLPRNPPRRRNLRGYTQVLSAVDSGDRSQSFRLGPHPRARGPSGGYREGSARSRATFRSRGLFNFHCLSGSG